MSQATSADTSPHRSISTFVPFLSWIRTYDRSNWLRPDILAGVTVAAFSVPESMAYAGLAGLSPEHGLYASMMALLCSAALPTIPTMIAPTNNSPKPSSSPVASTDPTSASLTTITPAMLAASRMNDFFLLQWSCCAWFCSGGDAPSTVSGCFA